MIDLDKQPDEAPTGTEPAEAAQSVPANDAAAQRDLSGWPRLGPGLISGAADDDPSGIITYTQAGAQLGYAACWILVLCYPLVVAVQDISARIGRATGEGIVAILRRCCPGWMVNGLVALIVFTNTVNLAADLGAMADVLQLLLGGDRLLYVAACGLLCAGLLLWLRLQLYIRLVTWATLSLAVYVVAAVSVAPSVSVLTQSALAPLVLDNRTSVALLAAVMGTTISPYLLIWQSSLEGERARILSKHHGGSLGPREASRIRLDTSVGMLVALVVACGTVLTAASTLHAHGITDINTIEDAAQALRPLTGPLTHILFSVGILATGLLAVPMLAGSAAYAVGEGRGWRTGLALTPSEAPAFYACIISCTLAGVGMNLIGFNSVECLIWSAVINGILALPILVVIMLVAARRDIMGPLTLTKPLHIAGWLSVGAMAATVVGLLATL